MSQHKHSEDDIRRFAEAIVDEFLDGGIEYLTVSEYLNDVTETDDEDVLDDLVQETHDKASAILDRIRDEREESGRWH